MRTSRRKQSDASINSTMAAMNRGTTTAVRLRRLIDAQEQHAATTAETRRVVAVNSAIARIVS